MKLSFGIYKKQLLFFIAVFLISWGAIYLVERQLSYASVDETATSSGSGSYIFNINISVSGDVMVNGEKTNKFFSVGKDKDELRFIAASGESIFISQIKILVHLPKSITTSPITQSDIGIKGIGTKNYSVLNPNTLVYQANDLSPSAVYTIIADFPKGYFDYTFEQKIINYIYNLPALVWLIISLVLPLATILFLFRMFSQAISDWKIKKPKVVSNIPPNDLSPAELSVLVEGKVTSRSISAILIDLASRNFIQIISKENDFIFGKKKLVEFEGSDKNGLKTYERILLSKIFSEDQLVSNLSNVQVRIGRHIFSRKIAEVYLGIYDLVSNKGYFLENPSRTHNKYKLVGIILFILALIGFVFGIFIAPDPKFYLLFWVGMMFSAFVIVKMSNELPTRTLLGQKELIKWFEFKNFLTDPNPISYTEGVQDTFIKYLPYAIVLGVEDLWAKRFVDHPFKNPDWYVSYKQVVILEDFVNSLFPIIGFVSRELAHSREPIV